MMSTRHKFPILIFLCHLILHTTSEPNPNLCQVNVVNDMHSTRPPLLLCGSSVINKFIYPLSAKTDQLAFHKGQIFKVFCPLELADQNNYVFSKYSTLMVGEKEVTLSEPISIECLGNDQFKIDDDKISFKSLACKTKEGPTLTREKSCSACSCYKIGYELSKDADEFLDIMQFCYDEERGKTIWAKGTVRPMGNKLCNQDFDNKAYKVGTLLNGVDMSPRKGPYALKTQFKTFKKLLGTERAVNKYIDEDVCSRKYLAKGELISHLDKLYYSEQEASFFYGNVVPIWEKVRAGNWRVVEKYIRSLANDRRRDLEIWAGGIDVLNLDNENIYLHSLIARKIPVPKILFKCVVDKMLEEGLCFIVMNNPYFNKAVDSLDDYKYCNIYSACKNVIPNYMDFESGYTYCCTLDDFQAGLKKQSLVLDGFEEIKSFDPIESISF